MAHEAECGEAPVSPRPVSEHLPPLLLRRHAADGSPSHHHRAAPAFLLSPFVHHPPPEIPMRSLVEPLPWYPTLALPLPYARRSRAPTFSTTACA